MTQEKTIQLTSGWSMLPLNISLVLLVAPLLFVSGIATVERHPMPGLPLIFLGVLTFICGVVSSTGHLTLQPNEACVYTLFGTYVGTARDSGFWWANPFRSKHKLSLRARNFESSKLKVNDKQGNPIDIATVVVWRIEDTAQAMFDVDNYEQFVKVQSESALRHLANEFAYDHGEENEVTLRSGMDQVGMTLKKELQERLANAGVHVDEARLTHLAYAAEIAQAMLRRQQAEAVIAARQKIVHGAVSMVQMALRELEEKDVVHLDDERKAAMVSNLLVVLCGESEAHPVINTGTLYQ
jgi:regulator of protease activity HflC (stomatin/prohibitin superfamily)